MGVQSGSHVLIYVITALMKENLYIQKPLEDDTFLRPTLVNAQWTLGSVKYPDVGKHGKDANNRHSQAYG